VVIITFLFSTGLAQFIVGAALSDFSAEAGLSQFFVRAAVIRGNVLLSSRGCG
jgi:hypothetical protein